MSDNNLTYCANPDCGDPSENLMKCTGCRSVAYCSPTCQRIHWPVHKSVCKAIAAQRREQEEAEQKRRLITAIEQPQDDEHSTTDENQRVHDVTAATRAQTEPQARATTAAENAIAASRSIDSLPSTSSLSSSPVYELCQQPQQQHQQRAPTADAVDANLAAAGCSGCGTTSKELHACSACKSVAYCSRECQRADWPAHKNLCKALAAERNEAIRREQEAQQHQQQQEASASQVVDESHKQCQRPADPSAGGEQVQEAQQHVQQQLHPQGDERSVSPLSDEDELCRRDQTEQEHQQGGQLKNTEGEEEQEHQDQEQEHEAEAEEVDEDDGRQDQEQGDVVDAEQYEADEKDKGQLRDEESGHAVDQDEHEDNGQSHDRAPDDDDRQGRSQHGDSRVDGDDADEREQEQRSTYDSNRHQIRDYAEAADDENQYQQEQQHRYEDQQRPPSEHQFFVTHDNNQVGVTDERGARVDEPDAGRDRSDGSQGEERDEKEEDNDDFAVADSSRIAGDFVEEQEQNQQEQEQESERNEEYQERAYLARDISDGDDAAQREGLEFDEMQEERHDEELQQPQQQLLHQHNEQQYNHPAHDDFSSVTTTAFEQQLTRSINSVKADIVSQLAPAIQKITSILESQFEKKQSQRDNDDDDDDEERLQAEAQKEAASVVLTNVAGGLAAVLQYQRHASAELEQHMRGIRKAEEFSVEFRSRMEALVRENEELRREVSRLRCRLLPLPFEGDGGQQSTIKKVRFYVELGAVKFMLPGTLDQSVGVVKLAALERAAKQGFLPWAHNKNNDWNDWYLSLHDGTVLFDDDVLEDVGAQAGEVFKMYKQGGGVVIVEQVAPSMAPAPSPALPTPAATANQTKTQPPQLHQPQQQQQQQQQQFTASEAAKEGDLQSRLLLASMVLPAEDAERISSNESIERRLNIEMRRMELEALEAEERASRKALRLRRIQNVRARLMDKCTYGASETDRRAAREAYAKLNAIVEGMNSGTVSQREVELALMNSEVVLARDPVAPSQEENHRVAELLRAEELSVKERSKLVVDIKDMCDIIKFKLQLAPEKWKESEDLIRRATTIASMIPIPASLTLAGMLDELGAFIRGNNKPLR